MNINIASVTEFTHFIIKNNVNKNDIVIDATCGNGHDTLFLADLVGPTGQVYGFDIQEQAIKSTSQNLINNSALQQVKLINDSYENIDKYVNEKIQAVMFNLGYLPNSTRDIITSPDRTITGINKAVNLLKTGGIITIVIYTGHPGGMEENNKIAEFIKTIDEKICKAVKIELLNAKTNAPLIYIIQKK